MAQIILNIDDKIYERVLDSFAERFGWTEFIENPTIDDGRPIPNPISKKDTLQGYIVSVIKEIVVQGEATKAATVARDAAETKARQEIIVTAAKEISIDPLPIDRG